MDLHGVASGAQETLHHIVGAAEKHKAVAGAAALGVGAVVYLRFRKQQASAANATSDALTPSAVSSDPGGSIPGQVLTAATGAGYDPTQLNAAAQAGYQYGIQSANIPPSTQLQALAVSATQQAGQTTAANCKSVTHCGGHSNTCGPLSFICDPIANVGDCVVGGVVRVGGCVGQAILTVGVGASATVLPSLQNGLQQVSNYTPSILGAEFGIPGLPTKPTSPSSLTPNPYYTPPIAGLPTAKPPAAPVTAGLPQIFSV